MTTRYMVAKAVEGKEFMYSPKSAHAVPARSAKQICDALNKAKYQLQTGQVWHVYELDWYTEEYTNAGRQRFFRRNGKLYEGRV